MGRQAITMDGPADCGIGAGVERSEDDTLLAGLGRFGDDVALRTDTLHAVLVRSPHAHATIVSIDAEEARALPGVHAIIDGRTFAEHSNPLFAVLRVAMEVRPCAVDRVRYVGEPVAMVLAADRYKAEDAAERVRVDYDVLDAVVDPERAAAADAPRLHPAMDGNVVGERVFTYGDPEAAFAAAERVVELKVAYPRNSCTPIEGYVVHAEHNGADGCFTVRSNFQGPFSLHPVMARALGVDETALRLVSMPESGGSFGVKQAVFPMIVLCALAARLAGRPVSWTEDRLEHLTAATSATNRVTTLRAAVTDEGEVLALDYDQLDDVGAYLRAPEPASLYRMHGNLAGAYRVRNIACRNRIVVTNKTPTGLNRGFGGPQHYFALERLMQRIAVELGLDPVAVIRRNLVPGTAFPYRSASGALLDSGDYEKVVDLVLDEATRSRLEEGRRRAEANGLLYGVGHAAVVEPSVSNMGYITAALTPEQRRKAGPKGGAIASATVAIGPTGGVSVSADSLPQGQGHKTVLAQVVAETLGLEPGAVRVVTEHDTLKDAWTIAAGNYSSRFAGAVAGAAFLAATRLRDRLAAIAAGLLNCRPQDVVFEDGHAAAKGNRDNAVAFQRIAGLAHWSPGELPEGAEQGLREVAHWSPRELAPPNERDEVNSSLAYGFVFDVCGVEIDPATGSVRIDHYVTGHDAGRLLNPLLANGQIHGAYAQAVGAALMEELAYGDDGAFLSGSFADYLLPTACEVPRPEIVHLETPSPFTPLGAKGLGEGNSMSTPVAIANAVADALSVKDVTLPLTRARVHAMLRRGSPEPGGPERRDDAGEGGRGVAGEGSETMGRSIEETWDTLLDPAVLASVIPGCRVLVPDGADGYSGVMRIGIGAVRGEFRFKVALSDMDRPNAVRISGSGSGALGSAAGSGSMRLTAVSEGETRLDYRFSIDVSGKAAALGGRMLDAVAKTLVHQFFAALARRTGGPVERAGLIARFLRWIRGLS